MASARLLSKLVSAAGSVSSGAIRRLNEGDQARGLENVRALVMLVAETLSVQSTPSDDTKRQVCKYIEALVDRYGTLRRSIDALGSGRRRNMLVAQDKAHAWSQAMSVGPSQIESTLKRHALLLSHLTNWATNHPDIEPRLDEYERWLDGPFEGEVGASGIGAAPAGAGLGAPPRQIGKEQKVVAHSVGGPVVPQSPMRLEDSGRDDGHSTITDVDALGMLEDSAEQAHIAGEGSAELKLVRLTVLHDKHPGEEPSERPLTDEQRAAIEKLKKDPDPYARAVGAVASRDFVLADGLIPHLSQRGVDPVLILSLQGDRLYLESRYDEALAVYRQARAKRSDVVTRLNVAVTLLRATRGSLEDNFKESIDLLNDTALQLGEGTREWAHVRSMLGLAWHHAPTGGRDRNMSEAIKCFDSALNALNKERDAQWWAETQLQLGSAWLELPTGDKAANIDTAIRHFESAMQVWTRDADEAGHPRLEAVLDDVVRALDKAVRCRLGGDAVVELNAELLRRPRRPAGAVLLAVVPVDPLGDAAERQLVGRVGVDRVEQGVVDGRRVVGLEVASAHLDSGFDVDEVEQEWAVTALLDQFVGRLVELALDHEEIGRPLVGLPDPVGVPRRHGQLAAERPVELLAGEVEALVGLGQPAAESRVARPLVLWAWRFELAKLADQHRAGPVAALGDRGEGDPAPLQRAEAALALVRPLRSPQPVLAGGLPGAVVLVDRRRRHAERPRRGGDQLGAL